MSRNVALIVIDTLRKDYYDRISPSDVVWDVGANIGSYALFASQRARSVIAFEPHPANVDRLKENAVANGLQLDVRPIALSDSTGSARLAVSNEEASAGGGSVSTVGQYEITLKQGVNVTPKPDIVKIDVEGHELNVLQGMEADLSNVRTVLIEVHDVDDLSAIQELLQRESFATEVRWKIGTRRFLIAENTDAEEV